MFIPFEIETETHDRQERSWIVWSLLAAYVLTFCYVWFYNEEPVRQEIYHRFGISRFDYHWWSAFTCTFLHGSFFHLAANALFLFIYGGKLERMLGSSKFAILYVTGAWISANLHILTMPEYRWDEPCIGASGAVSAVLGCVFVMIPRATVRCVFLSVLSFRPISVPVPAWGVLGMWFIGQLAYTLEIVGEIGGIAFWAHVAGFVVGAGMGSWFQFEYAKALTHWREDNAQGLGDSLKALANRLPERAMEHLETERERHPEAGPLRAFLTACASLAADADSKNGDALLAFTRARDFQMDPLKLSAYLQLVRNLAPDEIPPAIHLEGGFTAQRANQPQLAFTAFGHALNGMDESREEQLLRSIESIMTNAFDDASSAEQVRSLHEQP